MYLVAGLGLTGQSVLRHLQGLGLPCLAFDTREALDLSDLQQQFPQVSFATGRLPADWVQQFETLVLSPGIAQTEPWVAELKALGKAVIGDIELFAQAVNQKGKQSVIGITGSNGKSTVTTLVAEFLKQAGYAVAMGGNIGTPALDLLQEDGVEVFVLELSSFQLETTHSLKTQACTILNISEDHMDRYAALADYMAAKSRLLMDTQLAVLPEDVQLIQKLLAFVSQPLKKVIRFGLTPPELEAYGVCSLEGDRFLARKLDSEKGVETLVAVSKMALQGAHHQLNALAAMALTTDFEIPLNVYQQVLAQFQGLPHRTQSVAEIQGVLCVNDSKGTNVGATVTAIESFVPMAEDRQGGVILLAGGVGKEADFSPLQAAAMKCKQVILFGQDAEIIAQALQGEQDRESHSQKFQVSKAAKTLSKSPAPLAIYKVQTLDQAVQQALELAQAGDIVLFSPACASFDQFANYQARGEAFAQIVKALAEQEEGACH